MKKIYLTLLSAALVTGFMSCNGKSDGDKNEGDTTTAAQQDDAANAVNTPANDTMAKTSVPANAGGDSKMSGDNKMSTSSKADDKMTTGSKMDGGTVTHKGGK